MKEKRKFHYYNGNFEVFKIICMIFVDEKKKEHNLCKEINYCWLQTVVTTFAQ